MSRIEVTVSVLVLGALLSGCSDASEPAPIEVRSLAFGQGEHIPVRHTCDGEGISPPLSFGPGPEGTAAFALIMTHVDEDGGGAPMWILWGIDPGERRLDEDILRVESPAEGIFQGIGANGELGYEPPCPEDTSLHEYEFAVFALDAALDLAPSATEEQLEAAMDGHVVGRGALTGYYKAD